MEHLIACEACKHGAIVHESRGCTVARCRCDRPMNVLIDEALDAARNEIRREWHTST